MTDLKKAVLQQFVALRKGQVVELYDQGADKRSEAMDITEEGWCQAMCVHWISMKKKQGDFWQWMKSDAAPAAFRVGMARQAVMEKVGSADQFKEYDVSCMRERGISACKKLWDFQIPADASWEGAGQAIQKLNYQYFIVGMKLKPSGAHAVAAYKPDARTVFYFDPNFGEIQLPSANLSRFLAALEWKKFVDESRPNIHSKKGKVAAFSISVGEGLQKV
jgi:hypothetical protein